MKVSQLLLVEQVILEACIQRFQKRHFWKSVTDSQNQPRFVIKLVPSVTGKWRIVYKEGTIVTLLVAGTNLYDNGEMSVTDEVFWNRIEVALLSVPKFLFNSILEKTTESPNETSGKDSYIVLDEKRNKRRIRHSELLTFLPDVLDPKQRFKIKSIRTTLEVIDEVSGVELKVVVPGYHSDISDIKASALATLTQELSDDTD